MSKRSIEDVLGAIKVPVRSVSICLDGDLRAEHDDLTRELERVRREKPTGKMSDGTEARQVAERIKAVEARMRDSETTFKFRGLTKNAIRKLFERFPPPDPNPDSLRWNIHEGASALLAESAVEPTMTVEQAEKLADAVDDGVWTELVNAAWVASTGSTTVPFSARASAMTSDTGSN
jgi:hypothetical protein